MEYLSNLTLTENFIEARDSMNEAEKYLTEVSKRLTSVRKKLYAVEKNLEATEHDRTNSWDTVTISLALIKEIINETD